MGVTIAQDLTRKQADALVAYLDNLNYIRIAVKGVELDRGAPAFKAFVPSIYAPASALIGLQIKVSPKPRAHWWVGFEPPPAPWHRLIDLDGIKKIAAAFVAGLRTRDPARTNKAS